MIKVDVNGENSKSHNWPKIMVTDDGLYVLFAYSSVGTVIKDGRGAPNVYSIGFSANNWLMSDFTDLHGAITLRNGDGDEN